MQGSYASCGWLTRCTRSFKGHVSFNGVEPVNPSVCEPVSRVSDEGEHGREPARSPSVREH